MKCPRCGFDSGQGASCPRCGVVFAKLRESPPRRPQPSAPPEPPGSARSFWLKLTLPVLLVVAGAVALRSIQRTPEPAGSPAPPGSLPAAPATRQQPAAPGPVPPPTPAVAVLPSVDALPAPQPPSGLDPADSAAAVALAGKLRGAAGALDAADLRTAEDLLSRHADEPALRRLAAAVFATLATREHAGKRLPEALRLVERAVVADASNRDVRALQLALLLEASDWAAAEASARALLELTPGDAEGLWGLGYALFRQDRNREAIYALRDAVEAGDTGQARALLERLEKGTRDESGMTEQQLAHFHVRYDGDEHTDVGREILRALERHYATLVVSFDHQPAQPVPVILFSRQKYYDASGAPAWSGGAYDTLDGRIRIPIGGLTSSLTPDMDGTLLHELTHAFVHDISRGQATRDLHEGLAQYMEGKRLASTLSPDQLRALADGRVAGVGGFYLEALGYVEYLVGLRGLGGLKDLLRAMGDSGSAEAAFREIYGKPPAGLRADAQAYLKSRYGS